MSGVLVYRNNKSLCSRKPAISQEPVTYSGSLVIGVLTEPRHPVTDTPRGHGAPTVVVWTIAVHCLVTAMDDLSKSGPSGRLSVKMQICVVQRTLSHQLAWAS
jgi:hypothetical protein